MPTAASDTRPYRAITPVTASITILEEAASNFAPGMIGVRHRLSRRKNERQFEAAHLDERFRPGKSVAITSTGDSANLLIAKLVA